MAHTVTLTGLGRMPGTVSMSSLAIPNASTLFLVQSGAVLVIPRGVTLTVGQIKCLGAKGTTKGQGIVATEGGGLSNLITGAAACTLALGAASLERTASGTITSGTLTLVSGTAYTLGLGLIGGTGTGGGSGIASGYATQMPQSAPAAPTS